MPLLSSNATGYPAIVLKPSSHTRIRGGHLWVFKDEIVPSEEIQQLKAGDAVRVVTDYGYDCGVGVYNPTSQIAVRLYKWYEEISVNFFVDRLRKAHDLRQRLFGQSASPEQCCYRWVFGESDLLPGLIIDRYGDYCSVQFLSAGMDVRSSEIIDAIKIVMPSLRGVIAKNDSHLRSKEGLPKSESVLFGDVPDSIEVDENSVRLHVSLLHGQKTGYFLDQRVNRAFVASIAKNLRVLDCFTNQGGFALNAAYGGAKESVGIDVSQTAVTAATNNALHNAFDSCRFEQADVFEYLKEQAQSGAQWDMVILDPPAFTKSKATIPQAKRGYADINRQALKIISSGGFLVSSSCSHHITESMLSDIISAEAKRINRTLKLIFRGMQSPCHPILLTMPETQYLKFLVYQVL